MTSNFPNRIRRPPHRPPCPAARRNGRPDIRPISLLSGQDRKPHIGNCRSRSGKLTLTTPKREGIDLRGPQPHRNHARSLIGTFVRNFSGRETATACRWPQRGRGQGMPRRATVSPKVGTNQFRRRLPVCTNQFRRRLPVCPVVPYTNAPNPAFRRAPDLLIFNS